MFNADFFPTPPAVIALMLAPWLNQPNARGHYPQRATLQGLTILEPSAGSGTLLDWMVEHIETVDRHHYGRPKSKLMYACEVDPELKALLHGKDYKVIADDFLAYHGDHQFDLVVMNPPFSRGDEHVIHAYATVAPGGHVVALINSESVWNPYSETRQLLAKLIADHGTVEDLGQVFKEAQRKTNVEVSLIRLQKPAGRDPLNFEFKSQTRENGPVLTEDTFQDSVAVNDVIGNMMLGYDESKKAFVEYMRARRALEFFGGVDSVKLADEAIKAGNGNQRGTYNDFADSLKQNAWREVLSKLNIQKYLTHQVRQDFDKYGKQQGYMDFTKENVASLVALVFENRDTILEKAVVAVFDIFTQYHQENRSYVEGWKTNSKYKVNQKLILPRWVELCEHLKDFRVSHWRYSEYSDIDKCMCYLTGADYDECYTVERALSQKFKCLGRIGAGSFDGTCQSQFFDMRFFKKGTLHLTFRDEKLWEEFNLRACAGKLWLPEPEMNAYRARARSPFAPEPTPEPLPESRRLGAPSLAPTPGGLQFGLFPEALSQAA